MPDRERARSKREMGAERPRLVLLERHLRPTRQGWPARSALGRQDGCDRQNSPRSLEAIRPETDFGEALANAGTKTRWWENQSLGRRFGRLLPSRRGSQVERIDGQVRQPEVRWNDHDRNAKRPRLRRLDAEGDARCNGDTGGVEVMGVRRKETVDRILLYGTR